MLLKIRNILCFGLLWLFMTSFFHEYHFSLSSLEYNSEGESIEISIKLFTDDLEAAISRKTGCAYEIDCNQDQPKVDSLLQLYVNDHFQIKTEELTCLTLNFIGKEEDANTTLCYFEISNINLAAEYLIYNDFFNELFSDQQNVVVFQVGDKKHGLNLGNRTTEGKIKI